MSSTSVEILRSFQEPQLDAGVWNALVERGPAQSVFLTYEWQRAWWESFGRGQLLLAVARRAGRITTIAPLFSDAGMTYFVGSGGADYLGVIGDSSDTALLTSMFDEIRRCVPDFIGFVFYLVPDDWLLGRQFEDVAAKLQFQLFDEGQLPAPRMQLTAECAAAATSKTSLVRHERYFQRSGKLEVQHLTTGGEIRPYLDDFFGQHIHRWRNLQAQSLFDDPRQRDFYRRLTMVAQKTDWLRFTVLRWNDRPIAFHFGFCYAGTFLWYKPSFEIELARHSPGEVLLRQLLLAAAAEGATVFDFGIGDEAFKRRFATHTQWVRTWGLYDPRRLETTQELASSASDLRISGDAQLKC